MSTEKKCCGVRKACDFRKAIQNSVTEAVNYIKPKINDFKPQIGIVCGSGLNTLGESVKTEYKIEYNEIPNFPTTSVAGHEGLLQFGKIGDKSVVCMKGRIHSYEGKHPSICAMPIWIMKELGVEVIIVTAATGSLNDKYNIGDVVLVKDHINTGSFGLMNPLVGPNDESVGPRFPSMVNIYDEKLRQLFHQCAAEHNFSDFIREGVYIFSGGPCYETVAEGRALRLLGGDVVGMSMVHETTFARYLGIKTMALALVTNKVCLDYNNEFHANHEEVLDMSAKRANDMSKMVITFIEKLEL